MGNNNNSDTRILVIAALATAINVIIGDLVALLNIPLLYLDTLGTIFAGAAFGPFWGAVVGLTTNLIMGVTTSPTAIPFGLVNIAVGIIAGLMAKKGFTIIKALITGLILSVVAPLIGTPIRLYLFGGFTGSGADILISSLRAAGQEIFASTFIGVVVSNFVDKIISSLIVYFILVRLPIKYKPNTIGSN